MGHLHMEEGDYIYAWFVGSVLYVIRPVEDYFAFVGEMLWPWLHAWEATDLWKSRQLVDECIELR
jgi:hypothetical protein